MPSLFDFALSEMQAGFDAIEAAVPKPQEVAYLDGFTYRYVERTDQQAMVLKLARQISALRAGRVLLRYGFGQEVAILQRVLDETEQDIMFLCGPYLGGDRVPHHAKFLEYLFAEEFDVPGNALKSTQKRGMVSRDKIMAYNARTYPGGDPSTNKALSETLHKSYSGFVHGAAVHILDMYGGDPPHFHTEGLRGTSRLDDHGRDFLNYPYRGLASANIIALALGLNPSPPARGIGEIRRSRRACARLESLARSAVL